MREFEEAAPKLKTNQTFAASRVRLTGKSTLAVAALNFPDWQTLQTRTLLRLLRRPTHPYRHLIMALSHF
jgi:hypothetical protein